MQKSIAVDLTLIDDDDPLLSALEWSLVQTARQQDPNTLSRLQTVPGIGKIVRLVLLDAIHAIQRVPRGQDCVSSCRLGTCAKASAGKRDGTSGNKSGHASLTWAFSAAAVLCLRNNAQGQTCLARVEKKHGKGKALTILAHKVARAVYDLLTRDTVCAMDTGLNGSGSRAGEPAASLDTHGSSLNARPWKISQALRHGTRTRTEAFFPDPSRLIGHPLWLLAIW